MGPVIRRGPQAGFLRACLLETHIGPQRAKLLWALHGLTHMGPAWANPHGARMGLLCLHCPTKNQQWDRAGMFAGVTFQRFCINVSNVCCRCETFRNLIQDRLSYPQWTIFKLPPYILLKIEFIMSSHITHCEDRLSSYWAHILLPLWGSQYDDRMISRVDWVTCCCQDNRCVWLEAALRRMTSKYHESNKRADRSLCFWIALAILWCHTLIILGSAASKRTHLFVFLFNCFYLCNYVHINTNIYISQQ